jgi:hypothetical protein
VQGLRSDVHAEACAQSDGVQQAMPVGMGRYIGSETLVPRVAEGVMARVDRLKAIGNGQVPLCAATAWRLLLNDIQPQNTGRNPRMGGDIPAPPQAASALDVEPIPAVSGSDRGRDGRKAYWREVKERSE